MVRVICRRLAREDGVWGVVAASSLAAVLLATLALSLDLSAASSARTLGQAALNASLRSAAHDIVPNSIASASPTISASSVAQDLSRDLSRLTPQPLQAVVTAGPTVQGGELSAAISVQAPMPALLGQVQIPLTGKVEFGWLPH